MRRTARVMLSLAAVAALAGADAHASSPAFRLETAKPGYLIGEPVVVTITQHGTAAIYDEGWEGLGVDDAHLRILVDRGSGFTRFRRRVLYSTGERSAVGTLVPDGRRQEFVLSFDEAIGDVLFPAAGTFRIVVEYRDETVGVVRSNVSTVVVSQPSDAELETYRRLRNLPERGVQFYLDLTSPDDAPPLSDDDSRQIVAAFPRSVYLQGARVRSLNLRVSRPSDRFDPDDPHSPAPMDRRERNRLVRDRRAALVSEAQALVSDLAWGQFEPDALAVLASTYEANGQDDLARQTWQRVIDQFPNRQAADDAREAMVEDEPEGQYIEAGSNLADITVAPVMLRRGDTIDMSFWFRRRLLDGGVQQDLFERAGVLTMRVAYDDPSRGVQAAAAPMAFSVSVPTGEDAELLSELRRGAWLASSPDELRQTIARYPTSRYTPFLRLKMHGDRGLLLLPRIDPDTMQSIADLNRDGFEALARRVHAETAADLLDGPSWPVLEADRLATAVRAAERAGDADRATRARAVLFDRFASSGPAREILRDDAREAAGR